MRLVAGLGVSLAVVAAAWADDRPGRFEPFTPLSIDDLYVKRMRFDRREPRILVGIMDRQTKVTLGGGAPLRLMFDELDIPKVLYAPAGARYELRVLRSAPAKLRYWVVVHTRKAAGGPPSPAALMAWRKRGYPVRVFELGTILALAGNVLDTRELHIGIGGFDNPGAAERLIAELASAGVEAGERFVHEELVSAPSGTIGIYDASGHLEHRASSAVYVGSVAGESVAVHAVEYGRGYKRHGREARRYREHLYVVIDKAGKLALVNSIGAEKLLAGLVPAEIFAASPLEALKAQAVTARGEIFSKIAHRHLGDPFDLCSEQHCQVYAGVQVEKPATTGAVNATRGLLAFRPRASAAVARELVDSRYSSSCGGHSEANDVVWGTAASSSLRPHLDSLGGDPAMAAFGEGLHETNIRAFLESYPPAACARSSFTRPEKYRWKRTFTATQTQALLAHLGVGRPTSVDVLGRGAGGRVTGVRIRGTAGAIEVLRELPVRRLFDNLNSGMFVLDQARDGSGDIESLTFTGGGWGHGVGMCQMGAIGRAEHGHDFRRILAHYYNGAVVERIY